MAAPRQFPLRLVLLLALVPLGWWLLDYFGVLGRFNNNAMDALFLFRGQKVALDRTQPGNPPLKVIYVDIDAVTVGLLGERPWPRDVYALLIESVMQYGHAKSVGLDFMLSPAGMKSVLVDQAKAHEGNHKLGDVLQQYPQAVIAAVYSNIQRMTSLSDLNVNSTGNSTAAPTAKPSGSEGGLVEFPYLYNGHTDPTRNAYPEGPSYPLIGADYGTVGLIDVATEYSATGLADSVPRWIPLFAETEGTDHALNLLWGMLDDTGLSKDDVAETKDAYVLVDPKTYQTNQLKKIQKKTFYNLSLEMALAYLGLDHSNVQRGDHDLKIVGKDGNTIIDIPLTLGQMVEINWFSQWEDPAHPEYNWHFSAAQVSTEAIRLAEGTPAQKAEAAKFFVKFNGALVLIGPVDPILQDVAPTPFDGEAVPKVGVYGNLLKTFFTGEFIRRLPTWANALLLLGLTALVGSLAVYSGHRAILAKAAAVACLLVYILGALELFAHFTVVLPLVAPVGSAFSVAFIGTIVRLVDEERQKKRIKGMFATYLAPEVVNEIVDSGEEPELGGHQVSMTCFFSDVQSFSAFSEVLSPARLVELMNEYLTAMTDILQAERGSLDKYIGDAIVAMYGAPIRLQDDALRASVAACRMQKRLGELREKWRNEGDNWPKRVHEMRMRIGLNTGETVVGNMGSTMRFNYTMMGDTVNLAARCESGAKQFGAYIMCTEDTKNAAEKNGGQCLFRRLNKIKVKGRSTPVEVYEIVGLRDEASPDTLRCVEIFEQGLQRYFAQQWDAAIALFAGAEKLEPLQPGRDPGVQHNPSELMQEFCRKMKDHPPAPDWDGVLEMTEK